MREEEVMKMIKDSADHVSVPEGLEPENMMKKLRAMDSESGTQASERETGENMNQESGGNMGPNQGPEKKPGKKSGTNFRRYWKYGTAAAAVLLLVGLFAAGNGHLPGTERVLSPGSQATDAARETGGPEDADEGTDGSGFTASDDESLYQAQSYDEVYDRFQELWEEEQRRLAEYAGSGKRSFFDILFGRKSTAVAMGGAETTAAAAGMDDGALTPTMADLETNPAPESMDPVSGAGETEAAVSEAADSDAYSDTNVQVEGVDEGDVVKTDGTYIYVSSADAGTIRIIRPNGTDMEYIGTIADTSTVGSARQIEEFYLNGNLMTVIRSSYENLEVDVTYYPAMPSKSVTRIETYDLSDPKAPKLAGTVTQEGYYRNSRRSGDYIYTFTNYNGDVSVAREERGYYIPRINNKIIPADCIYMPEKIDSYNYLVVSSVDMRAPQETVETKAVIASGDQYYVSSENIYIASSKYDHRANQYDYTEMMKFSYRDGRIAFLAHGNINGYLNDQFSMDEYKGNLRLVSTLSRNNGKSTNSLYVLNEKLEKIGEIEDLAPDEQIYSARFMGDIGYFVTFRNMDPLFSVDLSNPEKPVILGELKITGFSEYLHPYADGLLLGIGQEINPETTNFEGLKLSMFDTSDPKNVQEVQKLVEESFEHSPAWGNHKSVLISPTRNLIGFTAESYDYDKREWNVVYAVYSYDRQNGFSQKLRADLDENNNLYMTRGLYIGDWLYVVENNQINAYSLNNFTHGGELKY